MKILVADDHALIREALHHLLRQVDSRVTVLEASDCQGARDGVTMHPDLGLLLLDLKLPDVGGMALLNEFRRDHPTLPIVVLSGLEDSGTVREVLARGAMGFIPKSSSNDVMLGALRLVLSGGRYVPPEILASDGSGRLDMPQSLEALHLTERQLDVLRLMAQGKSNKLICRELGLAEPTVKIHVTAVLRALKVSSRAEAIVAVNRLGLMPAVES